MAKLPNETQLSLRGDAREQRVRRWQQRFLRSLLVTPDVTVACGRARISRAEAYRRRAQDPAFAEAWQAALDASLDSLEAKAFAMAKAGDTNLIQWLLRCHRPERFREMARSEHAVLGRLVFMLPEKEERDA